MKPETNAAIIAAAFELRSERTDYSAVDVAEIATEMAGTTVTGQNVIACLENKGFDHLTPSTMRHDSIHDANLSVQRQCLTYALSGDYESTANRCNVKESSVRSNWDRYSGSVKSEFEGPENIGLRLSEIVEKIIKRRGVSI